MRRIGTLIATLAAATLLLVAGCRTAATPIGAQPATQPVTTTTTTPAPSSLWPDGGPPGVLAAISTQHFPDHDRVVFQFHGATPPEATIGFASRITEDPSDRPVPLLGTNFVAVVFHDARLTNAGAENDPSKVVRYSGATRLTPRYRILEELAVSGDFEAVLSFGLGLATSARLDTSAPAGSGSVIVDLWMTSTT
jgi:hypothetical protein